MKDAIPLNRKQRRARASQQRRGDPNPPVIIEYHSLEQAARHNAATCSASSAWADNAEVADFKDRGQ